MHRERKKGFCCCCYCGCPNDVVVFFSLSLLPPRGIVSVSCDIVCLYVWVCVLFVLSILSYYYILPFVFLFYLWFSGSESVDSLKLKAVLIASTYLVLIDRFDSSGEVGWFLHTN